MATDALEDSRWETVLKPQLVEVAGVLRPRRNRLSARLFSRDLISKDEDERFTESTKVETDLALDILRVLSNQGPGSFDKFCEVLLEVRDGTLRTLEKRLRPDRLDIIEGKHASIRESQLQADTSYLCPV